LHVANQALDQTRAEVQRLSADLAAAGDRERELRSHVAGLEMQAAGLRAEIARLEERGRELDRGLADALAVSAARQKRLEELDAEVRRMKASRSWRWTAWLRSLERFFSRR
jgi:septal ring factor EnvC (AmiA/AmiB activator)